MLANSPGDSVHNDAGKPGCVSRNNVNNVFLELKKRVDNLIEKQIADLTANASCNLPKSCSDLKNLDRSTANGTVIIDPDGEGDLEPFTVYCDMSDKNGVGVTVISHDRTSLSQLASLTRVSSHCEQFIKYECYDSRLLGHGMAWWVSRDSYKMAYWGGASPGSGKCACGMTNSCADPSLSCNCDKNDLAWREDSGLLTDKTHLPVKQLRFGDTGGSVCKYKEQGYHTLGKLKCYGIA
ncbi:hypothetical protein ACROYT_G012148 [Oculina patagonica]